MQKKNNIFFEGKKKKEVGKQKSNENFNRSNLAEGGGGSAAALAAAFLWRKWQQQQSQWKRSADDEQPGPLSDSGSRKQFSPNSSKKLPSYAQPHPFPVIVVEVVVGLPPPLWGATTGWDLLLLPPLRLPDSDLCLRRRRRPSADSDGNGYAGLEAEKDRC